MSKPLLLWTAASGFFNEELKVLKKKFKIIVKPKINKSKTIQVLKRNAFKIWVVDTCPDYKINKEILNYCPSLLILASPATGSTHLDIDYIYKIIVELSCYLWYQNYF